MFIYYSDTNPLFYRWSTCVDTIAYQSLCGHALIFPVNRTKEKYPIIF